MADKKNRIERVIPGKELPFTDFKGMDKFISDKIGGSARPAAGEDLTRDGDYGIDKDLPIEITDREGNTVTMTFGEYRQVADQIMEQVLRDKSAELCFTDIAFGSSYSDSGMDRADNADADSLIPGQEGPSEEEQQPAPEQQAPEEPEEEQEQDASEEKEAPSAPAKDTPAAVEKKGIVRAAGQTKIPAAGRSAGTGKRKQQERPASRRGRTARAAAPARRQAAPGRNAVPAAPGRKQAREKNISPAAPAVQRPSQSPPVRHLDEILADAKTTDRLNRSSQFIVSRAAFIADQSGRTASFVDRDGRKLEFRRVTDPETGKKEPKAFINGRELKTAQEAEDFIKGILKTAPERTAANMEMLVASAAENPAVSRGTLEKQVKPQRQAGTPGRD